MSPEAWKRAGRPSKLVDACRQRLLHDRDPDASWLLWRQRHGPANLDARKGARFSSSDLVLRAAAQGLGLALARHRLAADDVEAGLLMRPFGQHSVAIENAYWIVTRPDRQPRPAAETFIAWLKSAAGRANVQSRGVGAVRAVLGQSPLSLSLAVRRTPVFLLRSRCSQIREL